MFNLQFNAKKNEPLFWFVFLKHNDKSAVAGRTALATATRFVVSTNLTVA